MDSNFTSNCPHVRTFAPRSSEPNKDDSPFCNTGSTFTECGSECECATYFLTGTWDRFYLDPRRKKRQWFSKLGTLRFIFRELYQAKLTVTTQPLGSILEAKRLYQGSLYLFSNFRPP